MSVKTTVKHWEEPERRIVSGEPPGPVRMIEFFKLFTNYFRFVINECFNIIVIKSISLKIIF